MRFKIASFNMKNMGKTAISKRDFIKLAEIIRNEGFDIVSFQEILSEGQALDYFVKNSLPGWDLRWDEPREATDPTKAKDKRGEGYAFIWNTKKFMLAESVTDHGNRVFEPRILNKYGNDVNVNCNTFARTPFYARFVPVIGGFFELRLINIHIHFGDNSLNEINKRKIEYDILTKEIYPTISKIKKYGNNRVPYTIAMGDYNLNLCRPLRDAELDINPNTYIDDVTLVGNQKIATVQDGLTTLKGPDEDGISRGYSQNYDHFTFDVGTFDEAGINYRYRRIDAVRKYKDDDFDLYRAEISDHLPIVMEISFNEKLN